MHDEHYERPEIAERTPVSEPLNTITGSQVLRTPVWRAQDAGEAPYERPHVIERTSIREPLNTLRTSVPLITPAWRSADVPRPEGSDGG